MEKLLVKNLPAGMGERELVELLSPVCKTTVSSGPAGEGQHRQALIEVPRHEDARRIVSGFDGRVVDGRQINVEWMREQYRAAPSALESEVEIGPPAEQRPPPARARRPHGISACWTHMPMPSAPDSSSGLERQRGDPAMAPGRV
jgi:hypothetical protein